MLTFFGSFDQIHGRLLSSSLTLLLFFLLFSVVVVVFVNVVVVVVVVVVFVTNSLSLTSILIQFISLRRIISTLIC